MKELRDYQISNDNILLFKIKKEIVSWSYDCFIDEIKWDWKNGGKK